MDEQHVCVPQFKFEQLREPFLRLAALLAIHGMSWMAFAQLDEKKAALLMAEAGLLDPADFRDAYSQYVQLVSSKNAIELARVKAGAH